VKQIFAWILAAAAKFAALYLIVVKIICGLLSEQLLASGTLKAPMLTVLPATFSWPQLFTALIGGGLYLLRGPVLSVFIPNDPAAMSFALERASVSYPLYFIASLMAVLPSAIRGFGYHTAPAAINVVCICVFRVIWRYVMFELSGWLTFYEPPSFYLKMVCFGIVSYAAVYLLQMRKVRRIPMGEALKSME
jgi:Na+-driven multidrug efflux pump